MYTKFTRKSLFFDGDYAEFYKDGVLIARRNRASGGNIRLYPRPTSEVRLTRAQGFRYWERHFPLRACWDLPPALREAVALDPATYGKYIDRNGEAVGYAG